MRNSVISYGNWESKTLSSKVDIAISKFSTLLAPGTRPKCSKTFGIYVWITSKVTKLGPTTVTRRSTILLPVA
jgi:hypothetical protein